MSDNRPLPLSGKTVLTFSAVFNLLQLHGFNFTCYHPPRDKVGNCPVPGVGGVANKKYLLSGFAKYVLFLARFTRWLRTSRLRLFKEKRSNLSERGWRGITYQN